MRAWPAWSSPHPPTPSRHPLSWLAHRWRGSPCPGPEPTPVGWPQQASSSSWAERPSPCPGCEREPSSRVDTDAVNFPQRPVELSHGARTEPLDAQDARGPHPRGRVGQGRVQPRGDPRSPPPGPAGSGGGDRPADPAAGGGGAAVAAQRHHRCAREAAQGLRQRGPPRSEEHTSELQSLMRISYAVFCLKKKNISKNKNNTT